jgi:phosphatidylinositol glycan class V
MAVSKRISAPYRPVVTITKVFVLTKLLLISVVLAVPKQYDTSSQLIFADVQQPCSMYYRLLFRLVQRLTVWDSVYFTSLAQRGNLYEHEWAFGRFWWGLIRIITQGVWSSPSLFHYSLTSILLANLSHYLATLVLYRLTLLMFRKEPRFAQTTAALYVLSPAGIFLVAGYTESTFALLSFLGMYFREKNSHVISGALFAISCGFRTNGLLWGLIFVFDLILAVRRKRIGQVVNVVFGGSLIGMAFFGLQYYAYTQYCPGRDWCENRVPSIFSFVQSEYWNVGFLRYWTTNNIPNFLFALPTLLLMWKSSTTLLGNEMCRSVTPYIIVQLTLLFSGLFVYHVQIITRVATCLPTVYWYVAYLVSGSSLSQVVAGKRIVTYTFMWIVAQGVLYGAFLPPA